MLSGLSFQDVSELIHQSCPTTLTHAKGWFGQALEQILGTDAGSKACPDFMQLGVELKTLPLGENGLVKESTYVTYAPIPFREPRWHESLVYHKLKKVLWVPFLAEGPVPSRMIYTPFLWSMPQSWDDILSDDWYELSEMLKLGQFDALSAKQGRFLHIRPKAANSKNTIRVLGQDGQTTQTVPKGFYLRQAFAQSLLDEQFT